MLINYKFGEPHKASPSFINLIKSIKFPKMSEEELEKMFKKKGKKINKESM